MATSTRDFGVCIYALRIYAVGGNSIEPNASSLRHVRSGKEKTVRFNEGEVMLQKLEIRTANVAEVNVEKVMEGIHAVLWVVKQWGRSLGNFWLSFLNRTPSLVCLRFCLI